VEQVYSDIDPRPGFRTLTEPPTHYEIQAAPQQLCKLQPFFLDDSFFGHNNSLSLQHGLEREQGRRDVGKWIADAGEKGLRAENPGYKARTPTSNLSPEREHQRSPLAAPHFREPDRM
jgi:hypothetical protein